MENDKQALTTKELATLPLGHNWYQKLASNFEIIQPYLDKLDTDELEIDNLKNKFDDMSKKLNVYETNMQAIVNILSDYDVPIAIVDGKIVETKEGE
ncbi:hypothetical protein IMAU40072_02484 [Lactiplantibacillus plantarum]|uniref:hypothetical protein n=1 Tax=Lactiplantibacillus plantarum TaxID=1590 RepID=UPI001303A6FD|nr:hypothetical protein [Lactiplantibacillus plantarum]MCG0596158.1 hypothetical protein [Lactiplantibacillus plantarum]MCG0624831.1 hypothetical protein [Lactiplantibacillus plantarum]MCG0751836.1 hypothetical protein [Lactiplantibacillus plantarum]MCG0761033.1 hypothetical protein [Lactiplantibacillus plantarum]MCG0888134.1 hypothetical protein [Lactiplantibacillus plantarum]